MTNIIQRPWPTGAEDIGSWQDIFDFIVTAAIVTNAALIVFTMNVLDGYDEYFQFWIFIGFQWVMFVVQYVIRAMIPDDPFEVALQVHVTLPTLLTLPTLTSSMNTVIAFISYPKY